MPEHHRSRPKAVGGNGASLTALRLEHEFYRGARAFAIREEVAKFQALLRLGRIKFVCKIRWRQWEQLKYASV